MGGSIATAADSPFSKGFPFKVPTNFFPNPPSGDAKSNGLDNLLPKRVVTITPKPYVELPTPQLAKVLARDPAPGVVPRAARRLDSSRYQLSVENFAPHFAQQITPEVCWAACSQMVLSVQGLAVSQENILAVFQNNPGAFQNAHQASNDFASLEDICRVLENLGKGADGKEKILATPFEKSLHGCVDDVAEGRPVIACLVSGAADVGHAYVVKGMTIGFANPTILDASFFNPRDFVNRLLRGPWTYDPAKPDQAYTGNVDLVSLTGVMPDMKRYREFYFPNNDPFATHTLCLYDVTLADPYPGADPEVTMPGAEFKEKIRYLIRVRYKP